MISARRSRFEASSSRAEIDTRALTPELWSTSSLSRAAKAISSTSRRNSSGISIGRRSPRSTQASWRVIGGGLDVVGVVGEDLRRDAVLERRDDGAAVGVVLGVGREDHQDVERDAHREAADLEVALLEDVEQADLDARRQVGQLVDGEDAAVGARDDAEVDDLGVGEGRACGSPP